MNDFNRILDILKDILFKEGKDFQDKDVAEALGINQMNFGSMKKRKSVPFREILDFCAKRNILINDVFYNQKLGIINAGINSEN